MQSVQDDQGRVSEGARSNLFDERRAINERDRRPVRHFRKSRLSGTEFGSLDDPNRKTPTGLHAGIRAGFGSVSSFSGIVRLTIIYRRRAILREARSVRSWCKTSKRRRVDQVQVAETSIPDNLVCISGLSTKPRLSLCTLAKPLLLPL